MFEVTLRPEGAAVAIVGATGAVGREMVRTLARRDFPIRSLRLMASARSAGTVIETPYGKVEVEDLDQADFAGVEIGLFSAGGGISRNHAPRARDAGVVVIDNTSAFRMDPEVDLVVPEINGDLIGTEPAIIANPNCSTIQMVLALQAIREVVEISEVRVVTFQSASGAGQKGIDELLRGVGPALAGADDTSSVHARPLAFNCVPRIGAFEDGGYTNEELKMLHETRKILRHETLGVSATCVRVPVLRSHSEVVHVVTTQSFDLQEITDAMGAFDGLCVVDDPAEDQFVTPKDAEGSFDTFVSRIRRDSANEHGIVFWCVSDNLLKGAALNAVQIAERVWQKKSE